jgi:hypothetical protein
MYVFYDLITGQIRYTMQSTNISLPLSVLSGQGYLEVPEDMQDTFDVFAYKVDVTQTPPAIVAN